MFEPKVKLSKDLYERLRARAEEKGYASAEEFILHVLEQVAKPADSGQPDDELIAKQLKGLGYLD